MVIHPVGAYSDEAIYVYCATELVAGESNPDADEFITAKAYDLDEVISMIENGIITDGKTISAVLYVDRMLRNR